MSAPGGATGGFAIDGSWSRLGTLSDPSVAIRRAARSALPGSATPPKKPPPPPTTPPSDNALDWQYVLSEPTNVTPALWVSGAAENNVTDRMFAYGGVGGTEYFGAVDNLYCTDPSLPCPNVAWYAVLDAKIDGSAIALSPDGSTVYGVSSGGVVHAYNTADGSVPSGWPTSVGGNVSWASPWLDFQTKPYPLYVADTGGYVTRIDTSTGKIVWPTMRNTSSKVCSKPIHSSPIVWNNVVWVACDDGQLYRLNPATGARYGQPTKLCATGTCGTNDAVYSAPFIDTLHDRLLVGVNNQVIAIDISTTTGCTTGTSCTPQISPIGTSAIFYSSPFVDLANNYIYIAFNNKLMRATYDATKPNPITSGFFPAPRALASNNKLTNYLGYPKSSPMVFNGHVWVGDGGGFVNRFSSSDFSFEAVTPQYGVTIDTTPLVDVASGNIYYGTNGTMNGTKVDATSGSWVQLAQEWTYP